MEAPNLKIAQEGQLFTKQLMRLMMSQEMQMALKVLQAPILDLGQCVETAIEENPFLEYENEDQIQSIVNRLEEFYRSQFHSMQDRFSSFQEFQEFKEFKEESIIQEPSLLQKLKKQAEETCSREDFATFEILIGYLDDKGFLSTPLEEIAKTHHLSKQNLKNLLGILQTFEPFGIGACNLKESLLIQLKCLNKKETLAYSIIENHFEELLRGEFNKIKKTLKCTHRDFNKALFSDIEKLNIRPGKIDPQAMLVIIPDIKITEQGNAFDIEINKDFIPRVKWNAQYLKMLKNEKISKETKNYLLKKLSLGKSFLRSLNERNSTIHRIAKFLLKEQSLFFKDPKSALKPLTMQKVAQALNLNESTITRAVSNKYISTPRGTFALRSFFTQKYASQTGKEISSDQIKKLLVELVKKESKKQPLSDAALSLEIEKLGVHCARRTISKYRKELSIPSKNMRKHIGMLSILVLFFALQSCQVFVPEPPILPISKCHCNPPALPAPSPCAPLETPNPQEELSLSQLVDLGLCNSPLTRQAWANARVSAANLGIANSALFPNMSIVWTANRTLPAEIPNTGSIAIPVTIYTPQLTVSYLLWDFGGRVGAIDYARESLIAAGWNYSWTVQTVMFNVIQSYYNYLGAYALFEAAIQDVKDAQIALEAAQAQFNVGVNTIVDVFQAKAQLANQEMQVVQQKGAFETARAALAVALGLEPDFCLHVRKPDQLPKEQVRSDVERMLCEAKCCRPDLEGLRAGIRAQEGLIMQQYSTLWPTVTGLFTGGRTYIHDYGHDNRDFTESLVINIPIFSGFSSVNAIRQAEAEADSLIANYKNQELQALLAVISNYYAVRTAMETFEYSKSYLKYSQEAFDAVLAGYKAGNKMIVDVLTAETTLSDARASLVKSEFDWFISIANLAYSRGVLISSNPLKEQEI